MLKKWFTRDKIQLKHHVEFCISNTAYGDSEIFDRLLDRDDVEVEEVGCNSQCEICELQPYAIINNELIKASTTTELYAHLIDYIERF